MTAAGTSVEDPTTRDLWPLEAAVLRAVMKGYPAAAPALRAQILGMRVTGFENTGAGFFTDLRVANGAPPITERSPLDGGTAAVAGTPHGMGFQLFLAAGHAATLEGWCCGDVDTRALDFARVAFAFDPGTPTAECTVDGTTPP